MPSAALVFALLLGCLTACGGASGAPDVADGQPVNDAGAGAGDALACAQAKDYEDEARRVSFSVRNPMSDDFEVQKEYERQSSAANREAQRLRELAVVARRACEGTTAPAAGAPPPSAARSESASAADAETGYHSPFGDQSEAVAVPATKAVEWVVPGTFPIKVEQNDFDIPEDYTVKELRLDGSDNLTLRGVVQAGTRCVNGLEVRVDVANGDAPFTAASQTRSVDAGGTANATWDLQVSPDVYDPNTMTLSFEAVWLHGAC